MVNVFQKKTEEATMFDKAVAVIFVLIFFTFVSLFILHVRMAQTDSIVFPTIEKTMYWTRDTIPWKGW